MTIRKRLEAIELRHGGPDREVWQMTDNELCLLIFGPGFIPDDAGLKRLIKAFEESSIELNVHECRAIACGKPRVLS